MKISFHGAAQTVTGSKHIIHFGDNKKLLLDCGLFQGMGKDTMKLNNHWGFEPREIDIMVLSHAHIDHVGLLPKLVKDGYKGKVFCTPATADIAGILMKDSGRIQEADVRYVNRQRAKKDLPPIEPLYSEEDADEAISRFHLVEYNDPFRIDRDVELTLTDVGHILGSAAVNLKITEGDNITHITFSGDIGPYRHAILRSPQSFPQADYIILESTYGDKLHGLNSGTADVLLQHIKHTCLEKGGKLIIPAFAVGRTQEVLFQLNRLELEGRLPDLPYYVDSPLAIKATEIIKEHPDCFNKDTQGLFKIDDDLFDFKGLQYINSKEESQALNERTEPCVIISASGMAEAGRIKHHIAHGITNPKNTVLIVGYCDKRSLGGQLRDGYKEVRIFGDSFEVKADVAAIESLSAHGDYEDLLHWLSSQDAEKVSRLFLVHGETEVQESFKARLERKGFANVMIPQLGDVIDI